MAGVNSGNPQGCPDQDNRSSQTLASLQVRSLKEYFGSNCKVIENVGDFVYIVKVGLEGTDLTVKFQIDELYPHNKANTVLQSATLEPHQLSSLNGIIAELNSTTLLDIVRSVVDWLHESDIKFSRSPATGRKKKNTNIEYRHSKSKYPEEKLDRKAPSMKTALDVIHRVLWDESLPNEHFTIGYIDRFLGVIEKPFNVFSWEDLSSVDYNVLAIPKHRIQYFKYRGQVVWDKIKRLDDVFGSTGSKSTIQEVMDIVDQSIDNACADHDDLKSISGSESDDDIIFDTEYPSDNLYPRERYWGPKVRPTYFLALRVTDEGIRSKVKEIQETILDLEPSYARCLIPTARLHVTLCCLGLDTEEQVRKAVEIIDRLKPELTGYNTPHMALHLRSVSQFNNNTFHACVEHNEQLMTFVEHLKFCLTEAGVAIRDVFDFVPHMTILKLSMQYGREMRTRYLDPRLVHMFGHIDFGHQVLGSVNLCSMSEDRQTDGFYDCPTVISLT